MKTPKYILGSLIVGIVLFTSSCVSKKVYTSEVATADTATAKANAYAALNQQLTSDLSKDQAKLASNQIQIAQLQDQLKVTLVNDVMFPEGGYELNAAGKATLASIAPTLAGLSGQQIIVQGFTDNVPIVGELKLKFPTNLELSTARANNVTEYLISKGVPNSIISSQGFGEQRPVAPNDTPADKAKNRRVEIIVKAAGQ